MNDITLLEYYTGQALTGIMSRNELNSSDNSIAGECISVAKEIIKQLKEEE